MSGVPYRESGVLRACRDLLEAEHLFYLRLNSGEIQKGKYKIKLCPEGTPDLLILLWNGCLKWVVWVETKSSSGEQRAAQKRFQQDSWKRNEFYVLARSVDDLRKWLIDMRVIKPNRGIAS